MAGGRPSKLTPEARDKILQAVSVGVPLAQAARGAGITYQSLRNWVKKGEKQKRGEFRDFMLAVQEAEVRALTKWLAVVDKAALDGAWQAAAWKAERLYPQHFGRHRIEITGKDGAAIEQKVKVETKAGPPDPEDVAKRIQAMIDTGVLPGFKYPVPAAETPDVELPTPDAG